MPIYLVNNLAESNTRYINANENDKIKKLLSDHWTQVDQKGYHQHWF